MLEMILGAPYIIRILSSLIVILIINKVKDDLAISLLFGIAVLVLWTGHSLSAAAQISWHTFSSADNLALMLVIPQVIWLTSQMTATGAMKELDEYIGSLVSRRNAMAIFPAVIGLLPMPGGAIFSAPLVDDCDSEKNIDPVLKTEINYWFRHIWEYWWPLYPGIILAIDITGLPIASIMLAQFPLCIASIFTGYFFLLRKVNINNDKNKSVEKARLPQILKLVSPIIIIITVFALLKIFFSGISDYNKYLPMIAGIVTAQIALQIQRPLDLKSWKKIIFTKSTMKFIFIVALVNIYGAFIESRLSDGTLLISHLQSELFSLGIPVLLIIMLLPFIVGVTTGITICFVGASFPIVVSLIGKDSGIGVILSTAFIAYASGFMGVLLSPVHICLVMTCGHFKTSVLKTIFKLIKPVSVMISFSVILYFIMIYFL